MVVDHVYSSMSQYVPIPNNKNVNTLVLVP